MNNNIKKIIFSLFVITYFDKKHTEYIKKRIRNFRKTKQNLFITISVDWEGRNLDEKNINSIKKFNKDYPNIPLQHFLCPSYFTHKIKNANKIIRSTIKKGDNIGLHIHPWRSLVEKANVKYRSESSFYNVDESCEKCGHTVPLTLYNAEELEAIIKTSKKILLENNLFTQNSFRAGGWLADKNVLTVLINNNFEYDCSAVNWTKFKSYLNYENLYTELKEIWNISDNTKQPYKINIGDKSIFQFPNNGIAVDYMNIYDLIAVVIDNLEKYKSEEKIFLSFMFHQENANYFINRIYRLIDNLMVLKEYNYNVIFSSEPKDFLDL